jgi:GTPase
MKRKLASSIRILSELNVPMSRVMFVFNKIDLVSADELDVKLQGLRRDQPNSYTVCLSAKTSVNIGDLKSLINELLYPSLVNMDFQN